MTTYVHRPDHPMANERGRVDKRIVGGYEDNCASPYVISDVMEPTRHMATGRMHTSKSEFRKDTRRAGCVEVGNEVKTFLEPRRPVELSQKDRVEDIKRTISLLRSR